MPYSPPCHVPPARADLRARPAYLLLTVEWLGRTLRWSSAPVEVVTDAGQTLAFPGGLPALQPETAIDMLGQQPTPPRVALQVIPPAWLDVAQAIADGHRLDRAVGELSWWVVGDRWERREVIVRAPLTSTEWGGPGEPIGFTLEPQLPGEDRPIREPGWIVGRATAGEYTQEEGVPGPWVVGSPGTVVVLPDGDEVLIRATPAPRWRSRPSDPDFTTRILLTYGHVAQLGSVYVYSDQTDDPIDVGWDELSGALIELDHDDAGQPVSLLDVTYLPVARQRAATYWICWRHPVRPNEFASGAAGWQAPIPRTSSVTITSGSATTVTIDAAVQPYDLVTRLDTVVSIAFDGAGAQVDYKNGAVTYENDGLNTATTLTTLLTDRAIGAAGADLTADISYAGSTTGLATLSAIIVPRRGVPVDTLGDALAYAARRSRVVMDVAAWDAVAVRLRQEIAGYIDDDTDWWTWIVRDLLPLGPVAWAWSRAGYRPVYIQYAAGIDAAVWSITEGRGGVVRLPGSVFGRQAADMTRSVRVRWAYNPAKSAYTRSTNLTAGPQPRDSFAGFGGDSGDLHAEVQAMRYPSAATDVLESRWIWTRASAEQTARYRLAMLGASHRMIEIEGPQDLGCLRLGDVVAYSSAALRISSAVAHVVSRRLTDVGRVGLRLALLDHPAAVPVTTGPGANDGPSGRTGTPVQ